MGKPAFDILLHRATLLCRPLRQLPVNYHLSPPEFYLLQQNDVGGLGESHCGGASTIGIFEPDHQFAATEAGIDDPFTILSPARDLSVSK